MRRLLGVEGMGLRKRLTPSLTRWVGSGLLLAAFALRTYALSRYELTFDEVASVFIANRGPLELLSYVRGAIREHPPLYYLLLSLWMPLGGTSEFAVRLLSVIIGVGTVAAAYRVLRGTTHPSLALLGTLLLIASPFHIRISRDARMYGLLALWSLLSVSAFVGLLEHERNRGRSSPLRAPSPLMCRIRQSLTTPGSALARWGLFWIATCLGMFTHYFMVFVLVAENLYLLLNWRQLRRLLRPWLAVHAALGSLVALWAVLSPGLWSTLVSLWSRGTASTVRWQAFARALNGFYLGETVRPNWIHLGLCLVVTALGILLPLGYRKTWPSRRPGRDALLHGLLLAVPVAAMLALPERMSGRYLTPALPAAVVAMALGLEALFYLLKDRLPAALGGPWRVLAACLLPLGLLCGILWVDIRAYSAVYTRSGKSFREKTEYLDVHARPDDGLLLHGPWQALLLSYYDVGSMKSYTIPLRDLRVDPDQMGARLSQLLETHERLWVSYDSVDPVDPDWMVSRWLHSHAHQVMTRRGLTLYCRPPTGHLPTTLGPRVSEGAESEAEEPESQVHLPLTSREGNGYRRVGQPNVRLAGQLQLLGLAIANTQLTSEEAVLVLSEWRAQRAIAPGLTMRLELVGPAGRVWEDYEFGMGPARVDPGALRAGDTFTEPRGLVVPIGTPPGDYVLRLRALSPEGEEWLPESGEPLEVGGVRVEHHTPPSRALQALPGQDLQGDFEGTIALIGYAPWGRTFSQGNPILFDIYWQALDAPEEDYELQIEVVRDRGEVLEAKRIQPIGGWSPTRSWEAGDVLKGHYVVPLPADAPPGPYEIRLSLLTPDGSPLAVKGTHTHRTFGCWEREERTTGTDLVLFDGRIRARPRRYRPPAMDHRVDVVLSTTAGEAKVRLLGYDLTSGPGTGVSVEPGGSLDLTLYWKALSRMERVYAVFNHLLGPDGAAMAQEDGWPQQGAYHTSQWLPGEVVEDQYTIQVPLDAPAGEHRLRVGMYDAATTERLLVSVDGAPVAERYVELTTVTVVR